MCKFSIYTCDKFIKYLISTICATNFQLVFPVYFSRSNFKKIIFHNVYKFRLHTKLVLIWLWNIDYYVVKFFFYTRTTQLDYNVSRLHEVAMNQDQAFTNINKTLNLKPFQFLIKPLPRHFLKPLLQEAFYLSVLIDLRFIFSIILFIFIFYRFVIRFLLLIIRLCRFNIRSCKYVNRNCRFVIVNLLCVIRICRFNNKNCRFVI